MHVVLADPPAYTPPYDHALAGALSRQGLDVTLLTSRFRFGAVAEALGYTVDNGLYPLSSRVRLRHARLAARILEHPHALARVARAECDLLHLQWVAAPEADSWLLRTRAPLVFTAHDLLPRRTASRTRTWVRLFRRFDRVITHSASGRAALADFGVPEAKLRIIRHPVFASTPKREDDGRTVLALGVIRPYKGLPDAVEAVSGISGARLLVVGDPRVPLADIRAHAGDRVEWRLGYADESAIVQALGEATVAVFPYRPELDQSGALLQALGAGVPAVVYDVGGLGELVREFDAGRVVAPGDIAGLRDGLRELLDDPEALARACAGAERARSELTWDAAATAHRALYEELV